jgi:hypothetical protein
VLLAAILYEIVILLWAFGADGVTLPPFLRIPEEQYYFYELIFMIPMYFVTWLLASGIAYVMSMALGGRGPFDAILGGFGLTLAVSTYISLIPDFIQGILWTTGWVSFAEYHELTSGGIITVRRTQGLSRFRSALVALVSFLGSFAIWITIVR